MDGSFADQVLPRKTDDEVAIGMVRGFGGVITKLTPEQAAATATCEDSPDWIGPGSLPGY